MSNLAKDCIKRIHYTIKPQYVIVLAVYPNIQILYGTSEFVSRYAKTNAFQYQTAPMFFKLPLCFE